MTKDFFWTVEIIPDHMAAVSTLVQNVKFVAR